MFEPIAIVGRSCVLPGANSVDELWRAVMDRRDLTQEVPDDAWATRFVKSLGAKASTAGDAVSCRHGGYVTGFERLFDPTGFASSAEEIAALDAGSRWMLHCARHALDEARAGVTARERTGLVIGNLSYPSRALADFACATWLGPAGRMSAEAVAARGRFVSGLPALMTAHNLGLGGPAFAIDAACASSLYAVKIACDLLHDRRCDVMLAGGVNSADDLFLHVGFTALNALSVNGRCRPLTRQADGLLPAEGAALLALKRLDDAIAAGDRIVAVIRGVGLSNDGRERGLLAPDGKGQKRALHQAYELAGVDPAEIGYVECHATGTTIGDAEEIRSMAAVFAGRDDLPLGALKGNLGHLITASGAAAILKVTAALEAGQVPPTLDAEDPLPIMAGTPLRLLSRAEPWNAAGVRRAGINAFGFGGNNAHLILEEPPRSGSRPVPMPAWQPEASPDIAICGIGVLMGEDEGIARFARRLRGPARLSANRRVDEVRLPANQLRFPPADLRNCLGQQTLALSVAFQALDGVKPFDPARCGVYFGMGCDPESARWGLRWRLDTLLDAYNVDLPAPILASLRDSAAPPLTATGAVGCMPNIPANRLNAQFDFRGPGFTVSAEELSGLEALRLAQRALSRGEIDAALVGAVDLSCEPVHQAAIDAMTQTTQTSPADGAVALLLKRLGDAQRDQDQIFAVLPAGLAEPVARLSKTEQLRRRFGQSHAASGLLEFLGTVVEAATGSTVDEDGMRPILAAPQARQCRGKTTAFTGQHVVFDVTSSEAPPPLLRDASSVRLLLFAGRNIEELAAALDRPIAPLPEETGCRLAIVASDAVMAERQLAQCRAALAAGTAPQGRGISFQNGPAMGGPACGEVALVFAGANAYPGMGRDFFLTFPEIGTALAQRFPIAQQVASDLYGPEGEAFIAQPFGVLKAGSLLCQAHALAAERLLGLRPHAVMGLSSGETNGLFAFGVWRDLREMFDAIERSDLYGTHLAGQLTAVRQAWRLDPTQPLSWQSWLISAAVGEVASQLADNDRAEIAIRLSPKLCIVSGTAEGCAALLDRIGRHLGVPHAPTLVCHSALLEPFAPTWSMLHDRETHPAGTVRFYSQAHNASYEVTRDAARDALLWQARHPIDFGATIERAWQDGVRVFVEAGPRNLLSRAIAETLADRPHLALSLDDGGRDPHEHLASIAARLFVAGVPLNAAAIASFVAPAWNTEPTGTVLTLPSRVPAFDPGPLSAARGRSAPPPREAPDPEPTTPLFVFARERSAIVVSASNVPKLSSPHFDRGSLEELAGGRISRVLGGAFLAQEKHARQVRMPMAPLLLADRVVSIEGEAGVLGKGRLVTETDITADRWFLSDGRMTAGLLIEAGQADLLLISWMGIDAHNRGERVYRLLGCEITFHPGGMPGIGDTLRFDIHVDGHAELGDVRMFFFGYDSWIGDRPVTSVRNGQAGFFSDAELAAAKGVNWTAPEPPFEPVRLPDSVRPSTKRRFSAADLASLARGDAYACFGPGFEQAAAHQHTPRLPEGRLRMLDEITRFEPEGGPFGLGYLEAKASVPTNAWFYEGHFLNDPCMPGTLMADGAVQALSFHMAALGLTLTRDSWRFEPVTGEAFKFVCRGQVTPDAPHELRYEVFVLEIADAPTPTVYASLLCTCDGLKVFHCPRFGLRLVPDWILARRPQLLAQAETPKTVRADTDVRGDSGAILACAWGRPSIPFGATYAPFDATGRVPRLPGPPYLFVTRITDVTGPAWEPEIGLTVTAQYDVPPDAWYFRDNDRPVMPFAVLSEVLLQPCGWVACYAGFARSGEAYLRNLDGSDAIQRLEVTPHIGTLTTQAVLTRFVKLGALTLMYFTVRCCAGDQLICSMTTSFGIFTAAELAKQAGLVVTDEMRALLDRASASAPRSIDTIATALAFPTNRLRMVDEVTGYWPQTAEEPGQIRCRRAVSPHDWYFKAHFYEDPVQPGSLGLEALLQSLKAYLLLADHGRRHIAPRFEPIALGQPLTWKYRGQVVSHRKEVTTLLTVRVTETPNETLAIAEGTLWVDGLPIYEVSNLAVRIVGTSDQRLGHALAHSVRPFRPTQPDWVGDHCPTYTRPALPLVTLVAELAELATQASGRVVTVVRDLRLLHWMLVPEPGLRLVSEIQALGDSTYDGRVVCCAGDEDLPASHAPRAVARARIETGLAYPAAPDPWEPLEDAASMEDPYTSGHLFHGPRFHLQRAARRGPRGATATLELVDDDTNSASDQAVLLLDAVLHAIPHDEPELWLGEDAQGFACYPDEIASLRFYGKLPRQGRFTVETRAFRDAPRGALRVRTQLRGEDVLLEMEHTERLVAKGKLGRQDGAQRRRFLSERHPVPGMGLSSHVDGATRLSLSDIQRSNWLPGTLEHAYRAEGSLRTLGEAIAVKEHFASRLAMHPAEIDVVGAHASCRRTPFQRYPFTLTCEGLELVVTSPELSRLESGAVAAGLAAAAGIRSSLATCFLAALACERFSGFQIDEEASAVLTARGLIVTLPKLDGLDGLALAVLLAAHTGLGALVPPDLSPDSQALAQLLSEFPAGRHEPVLRAMADGVRLPMAAHLLLPADHDVARPDWADRPVLRVRLCTLSGSQGIHLGAGVPSARDDEPSIAAPSTAQIWRGAVERVARETGFDLTEHFDDAAAPASLERQWMARLAQWSLPVLGPSRPV